MLVLVFVVALVAAVLVMLTHISKGITLDDAKHSDPDTSGWQPPHLRPGQAPESGTPTNSDSLATLRSSIKDGRVKPVDAMAIGWEFFRAGMMRGLDGLDV